MSEQPNALLTALVAASAAVLTAAVATLLLLADCGVGGFGMRLVASLSACLVVFHRVHSVPLASLVVAGLLALSIVALMQELVRAVREQRRLRRLPLLPAGANLAATREEANVPLYVLPSTRPVAFCYGLVRPRVVISARLLELLGGEEREAALWHELAHARARDPLRSLCARLASAALVWLPAVRDLLERYLLVRELAADRLAVEKTNRGALAGALCGVVGEPAAGAVGLAELAAPRLGRLLDPAAPLPSCFGRRRLLLTLGAATVIVALLALPAEVEIGRLEALHAFLASLR